MPVNISERGGWSACNPAFGKWIMHKPVAGQVHRVIMAEMKTGVMTTMSQTQALVPTEITLKQQEGILCLSYETGENFALPCEYLRVFSPSAEVRGHGVGQEVLQIGKRGVNIVAIDPVGHYAVKLSFSDGHNSGLYSWDYLYELGRNQGANWQTYLAQLANAGASRDPA